MNRQSAQKRQLLEDLMQLPLCEGPSAEIQAGQVSHSSERGDDLAGHRLSTAQIHAKRITAQIKILHKERTEARTERDQYTERQ